MWEDVWECWLCFVWCGAVGALYFGRCCVLGWSCVLFWKEEFCRAVFWFWGIWIGAIATLGVLEGWDPRLFLSDGKSLLLESGKKSCGGDSALRRVVPIHIPQNPMLQSPTLCYNAHPYTTILIQESNSQPIVQSSTKRAILIPRVQF